MESTADKRLVVSRRLVLGWCVWLLVSWIVNLSKSDPARAWVMQTDGSFRWQIPSEAFAELIRGMLISAMVGMGLMWPAWRMMEPPSPTPGRDTMVDLAAMWSITQVIVLPMVLLTDFSIERLMMIDATLAVWAAAAGVFIWLGRRHHGRWSPTIVVALCASLLLGAWGIAWASGSMQPVRWNPLYMLWMQSGPEPVHAAEVWLRLKVIGMVIAAVWSIGLLWQPTRRAAIETL